MEIALIASLMSKWPSQFISKILNKSGRGRGGRGEEREGREGIEGEGWWGVPVSVLNYIP